jgi:hypothetical protein
MTKSWREREQFSQRSQMRQLPAMADDKLLCPLEDKANLEIRNQVTVAEYLSQFVAVGADPHHRERINRQPM